jgi:hypothetical protein
MPAFSVIGIFAKLRQTQILILKTPNVLLPRQAFVDIEKLGNPANFICWDRKTGLRDFAPIGITIPT